jgi:hypothetical protein
MPSQAQQQIVPEKLQGKRLLSALRAKGIEANNVTRNRRTGVYTIKFAAPNMSNFYSRGTLPARVWAQRIEECFTDVETIDTYDSVAEWRPQRPILFATVFIRIVETLKDGT